MPGFSRQPGLIAGRKRSQCISQRITSPSAPLSTSDRTVRKSLSQRRLWKTLSTRPAAPADAIRAGPSPGSATKGLSITTCLPAASAARASGAWLALGVAITTRSIEGSAISAAGSAKTGTFGQAAATTASFELAMPASRSPGVAAISGAWKALPARPKPIRPVAIGVWVIGAPEIAARSDGLCHMRPPPPIIPPSPPAHST